MNPSSLWDTFQISMSGLCGCVLFVLFVFAIIQLCRAHFFLLEPTDTFLFYFTFILCVVKTCSHFFTFYFLWNLKHALQLLLQVSFCLIFLLTVDPQKRISLYLKIYMFAWIFVVLLYIFDQIVNYFYIEDQSHFDWRCAGFLSILFPSFTLVVSTALTIVALRATKRAKHNLAKTPLVQKKQSSASHTSDSHHHPTRKDTIAQKIRDYYFSSQQQLQHKRSEVLILVITNFFSILVETSFILFLTAIGTPFMKPSQNSGVCEAKFDWSLIWIMLIQFLQTLSSFTPILLVFYFIYWAHRHHARPYKRQGSDILLCDDDSHSPLLRRLSSVTPPRLEQQDWIEFHDTVKEIQPRRASKVKKIYIRRKYTMDDEEERMYSSGKLPSAWMEPLIAKECASD